MDATRYPTASAAGGVITVQTDEDGLYRFDKLPCAYTDADGKQYLAGLRPQPPASHRPRRPRAR